MSKNTTSIQRRIAVIFGKLTALEKKKLGKHGNQRHHINWNISAKKGLLAHLCRLYLLKGETND